MNVYLSDDAMQIGDEVNHIIKNFQPRRDGPIEKTDVLRNENTYMRLS
jgi:hypothetical protein